MTSIRWEINELNDDGEPTSRWYGWACGKCGASQMQRRGWGSIFRFGTVTTCNKCGASLLDAVWRRLA